MHACIHEYKRTHCFAIVVFALFTGKRAMKYVVLLKFVDLII